MEPVAFAGLRPAALSASACCPRNVLIRRWIPGAPYPTWTRGGVEGGWENMGYKPGAFECVGALEPWISIFWVLYKVIFYFPNRKSTIWGIYSEYFLFFGNPLSKSKYWLDMVGWSSWVWSSFTFFRAWWMSCRVFEHHFVLYLLEMNYTIPSI